MAVPHLSPSELRQLAEAWEATGLDPDLVVPLVVEMDERRRDIKRQHDELQAARSDRSATIVDRLAAGDVTLTDAMLERATLADTSDEATEATRLLVQDALAVTARTLSRHFRRNYDTLKGMIFEADSDAVARAAELGPVVADCESADAAMAAGGTVREAWSELATIVDQRTALRHAYQAIIRLAGAEDRKPNAVGPQAEYSWYRHVDVDVMRRLRDMHPVRQLTDAIAAGLGPGMYTQAEAARHEQADADPTRPLAQPGQPPVPIDRDGFTLPTVDRA